MVLQGKKKLLKMKDVNFCNAPSYDETGVKALYAKVIEMPNMADYFPSKFPKGRQCDLKYLYNVWNTLHPNDVKEVIQYANNQRHAMTAEKVKDDSIFLTEEWKRELESLPF